MNTAAWVVLVKEVKDNLRDRRTVISALLFGPLFGPLFFALMVSVMVTRTVNQIDEALELPVVGAERAPNLVQFLEAQNVTLPPAPEDPQAAVRARRYDVVLVIPPEFAERFAHGDPAPVQIVADSSDGRASKHAARARALVGAYAQRLAQLRVLARGVSPTLMSPIPIEDLDVATPTARSVLVLGMMTYFILFAVLVGGMYLAADTTAGERDRGSLEPLLALPVTRSALVVGKLGATCAYMLTSLAITLTASAVCLRFVPLDQLDMVANFGPVGRVARVSRDGAVRAVRRGAADRRRVVHAQLQGSSDLPVARTGGADAAHRGRVDVRIEAGALDDARAESQPAPVDYRADQGRARAAVLRAAVLWNDARAGAGAGVGGHPAVPARSDTRLRVLR